MRPSLILTLTTASLAAREGGQIPIKPPTSSIDTIPLLGLGTWNLKIDPQNTTDAVKAAIETGYIHIDCAAAYGNQIDVGRGIKEGLLAANKQREDIWVTSKLWNDHHDPSKVQGGLENTLKELGLEYLDLYLMHWPVGNDPETGKLNYDYVETWHAMEKLLDTDMVRYIGVSNFSPHQLYQLVKHSKTKPAVHQMELHPYLQQSAWVEFHRAHRIGVTAYSPLGNTNPTYHSGAARSDSDDPPPLLGNEVLAAIAEERGCTTAQVALAWGMLRGTSVIPKSSHVNWIEENFGAIECPLSFGDMARIKAMEETWLKRFNNPSEGWGVDLFEGLDGV